MKDNPALPGGSLKSKPTWGNTLKRFPTSAFFAFGGTGSSQTPGRSPMAKTHAPTAQCPGESSRTILDHLATACDFPAAFQAELTPTCPSCSQPMVHVTGYFHCPQCCFAICEDSWAPREREPSSRPVAACRDLDCQFGELATLSNFNNSLRSIAFPSGCGMKPVPAVRSFG